MSDTEVLKRLVERYQLEVAGVRFWVPYWVNSRELMRLQPDNWIKGPYKGKGTPDQIKAALQRRLRQEPAPPTTAEGYRRLMRRYGIGIDCSGFIYYVLNGYLRHQGRGALRQHLVVPRDELLRAHAAQTSWRRYVTQAQIEAQPEMVGMAWVAEHFKKDPRMITNVARLVHPQIVHRIRQASQVRPADLIKMTSEEFGDHIGIVVSHEQGVITYAESTEPEGSLGGVGYNRIMVADPAEDLNRQRWDQVRSYHPERGNDGVWRLNALKSDS
jgi:hypothetical protein